MLVEVSMLREVGRPIPNWRMNTIKKYTGMLALEPFADGFLRRTVNRSVLLDRAINGENVLPPLIDAFVTQIEHNEFSITGFERVDGKEVVQNWVAEVKGQSRYGMNFAAAQMRYEGILLPKSKRDEQRQLGMLKMENMGSIERRFRRQAEFVGHGSVIEPVFTSLADAAVLWIRGGELAIAGCERIRQADFAQTWHLQLV